MEPIRLQKFLADQGIASRRKCEEFIESGRVKVNGKTVELGFKVDPEKDKVEFDGKIIIIGSNANAQGLEDIKRTPVSDTFSGPEIHASSIENMLDSNFIINVSPVYNLLLMISMFALIFIIVSVLPSTIALAVSSCTMFMFLIGTYLLYLKGIAINFIAPEVFMIIAIGIGYSYRYIKEGIKKHL